MCDYCEYETEDSFRIKRESNDEYELLVDNFYSVFKFKKVEELEEEPEFEDEDESEGDGV